MSRISAFSMALFITAASCLRPDIMSQARKMTSLAEGSEHLNSASQTNEFSFANKTGESMSIRRSRFFGSNHKLLSLAKRLLDGRSSFQEFGTTELAEKAKCTCPRAGQTPIPDPIQYVGLEKMVASIHAKCSEQTAKEGCMNDHECEWTQASDGPLYQRAAVTECRASIRYMFGMFLLALDPNKCKFSAKDKMCAHAVSMCYFLPPAQCGKTPDHCALETCSSRPGADAECFDDLPKTHDCYGWGMHPDQFTHCPLFACDEVSTTKCGQSGQACALFEHEFCGEHHLQKEKVCEATDAAWLASLAPGQGRFFRDFVACQRETCPTKPAPIAAAAAVGPRVDVSVSVSVSTGR